jgi:putative effector of murein hydrolase
MSVESRLRTVTPLSGNHRDGSMNAVGLVLAGLIALVLLPLLPVLLVVWAIGKLLG